MAKIDREPKDPVRKGRAEAIRAATGEEWAARPAGKLEKQGRDGLKLVVAKAPEFILDDDGEIVGVDAWVQLFDERGRELPIDPHRRIINPPTVPRAGVRLVDTGQREHGLPVMARQVTADPMAAFWEAVWDSVEEAPNTKGWRTRGTVTTVFAGISDGSIESEDEVYSTTRAGNALAITDGLSVGQYNDDTFGLYGCVESFVSFDTSAIPDVATVSAVDLAMWLTGDSSDTDFTVEARTSDWGVSLASADWVAGASLGGLTLLASINTSGIGATGSYKTYTSQAAFLTAPNLKTGTVYILISSSRHRIGNTPGLATFEAVTFASADVSGTTQDPKLTITHAGGGGSAPFFTSQPNRIWRLG